MKHTNRQRLEMTLLLLMLATVIFVVLSRFLLQIFTIEESVAHFSTHQSEPAPSVKASVSAAPSTNAPMGEAIVFDPNTADTETLQKVGFAPWQAKNIMNYRAKGGAFHRKEDVKRIYGMTYGLWEHIEPLIRIGRENLIIAEHEDLSKPIHSINYRKSCDSRDSSKTNTSSPSTGGEDASQASNPTGTRAYKLRKGETVDISLGDTALLQRIPGIGPKKAIILSAYIQKLGGLASADQLNDDALHDMPLDLEDYISFDASKIRKLHINSMTAKQLAGHPYIRWTQAKQIADRVRMFGPIRNWDELLFLSEFTEADRARLEPYISFD